MSMIRLIIGVTRRRGIRIISYYVEDILIARGWYPLRIPDWDKSRRSCPWNVWFEKREASIRWRQRITKYEKWRPLFIGYRVVRSCSRLLPSANPVRNYKRSWALVNGTSGPSQAEFASADTNLPFFVNYILFIILMVDYNYISKLQLIAIDFGRLQSFLKPSLQIVKWLYSLAHPRMLVNCL